MYFSKQRGDRCGKKLMFIATANVMVLNVNTELMTKKRLPCKYKVRHGSVKTNSFCESCMVMKVNFKSNLVELTCQVSQSPNNFKKHGLSTSFKIF